MKRCSPHSTPVLALALVAAAAPLCGCHSALPTQAPDPSVARSDPPEVWVPREDGRALPLDVSDVEVLVPRDALRR